MTVMALQVKALQLAGETNFFFISTRSVGTKDRRIHPACEAVMVGF